MCMPLDEGFYSDSRPCQKEMKTQSNAQSVKVL